jgi:hypothetical protein
MPRKSKTQEEVAKFKAQAMGARIPLTPPLSQRERENRRQLGGKLEPTGDVGRRPLLFRVARGVGKGNLAVKWSRAEPLTGAAEIPNSTRWQMPAFP